MWMKRKLLIWGTTYPEFSKTYFETVCTGAIDGETGRLVRVYPLTLRHMTHPFKHYQWIEAEIAANSSDFRPESHKVKQDSIRLLEHLDTKDGWAARSKVVLGPHNVFESVEALRDAELRDHTSLGLVRPDLITRFYARKRTDADRQDWEQHRQQALAQRDLWVDPESQVRELRFRTVDYRVAFTCANDDCNGHDMSVLDWGLYVLHRRMVARHGPERAQKKVIEQLLSITDTKKNDVLFFLGNTKAHSQNFMVVGVYHPPKNVPVSRQPAATQQQGFGFLPQ